MEEEGQTRHQESSNNDIGPSVSSSSYASVQGETEETVVVAQQDDHPVIDNAPRRHNGWRSTSAFRRLNAFVPRFGSSDMRSDVWSCLVVFFTFWLLASMIMILGFYGSYNLELGPSCSYQIEANPLFVHAIKVAEVDDHSEGPMMYGFHKAPSLDVEITWSQQHNASLDPDYHREWTYYLNAGSQITVSYEVKFPSSDPLSLVIAQGRESLIQWIDDPSYPNTTLSWNIIYGSGQITQEIEDSDTYYVAVGNLNMETAEVYLNVTIWSLSYNTTEASLKCSLSNQICSFKLILLKTNVAVITTPGTGQVNADKNWYIQLSFGPQWLTYGSASCIVAAIFIALFRILNQFQSDSGDETGNQARQSVSAREPLLSPKNDDSSSRGSSYDSASNDEEDLEEKGLHEGKALKEGDTNSNIRRLCTVCFDAQKDCFFVPCGHSATCFSCGSRIADEAGTCPICRRKLKKVRKIFSV